MAFFGGSKSSTTSTSTEQGSQTGDESLVINIAGGGTHSFTSDTPATLRYLAGLAGDISSDILEATENVAGGLTEATIDANRNSRDTAAQLNLSLAEGIKELNLRSTETKAATTTARNLLIAAVVAVLAIVFFLRRPSSNAVRFSKKSK